MLEDAGVRLDVAFSIADSHAGVAEKREGLGVFGVWRGGRGLEDVVDGKAVGG